MMETTETLTMNESMPGYWECEEDYIPTVSQYRQALGAYYTVLMVVATTLTVVLYALFLEQIYFIQKNVNKAFRKNVLWITSVYPFMCLMSLMSVIVPRAHSICTAVKVTYMCIGISNFMGLTALMFGSEKVMLWKLEGTKITVSTGPACCVCPCLPKPAFSKQWLRWVRWMLWQMPYTQAFYFILAILWATAESGPDGTMDPNAHHMWLDSINVVSFLVGVWALNILDVMCKDHLAQYEYSKKSFAVKILVLVTKLQSLILDILFNFDVFPCLSIHISPRVYKHTLENSMYFAELLVLGPFSYWQYHNILLLAKNPGEISQLHQDAERDPGCVSKTSEAKEDHRKQTEAYQLQETRGGGGSINPAFDGTDSVSLN